MLNAQSAIVAVVSRPLYFSKPMSVNMSPFAPSMPLFCHHAIAYFLEHEPKRHRTDLDLVPVPQNSGLDSTAVDISAVMRTVVLYCYPVLCVAKDTVHSRDSRVGNDDSVLEVTPKFSRSLSGNSKTCPLTEPFTIDESFMHVPIFMLPRFTSH